VFDVSDGLMSMEEADCGSDRRVSPVNSCRSSVNSVPRGSNGSDFSPLIARMNVRGTNSASDPTDFA